MRILFVAVNTNPLNPPTNGDSQRTRLLYEACTRFAEVEVLALTGSLSGTQRKGKWRKWAEILPFAKATTLFPVNAKWETAVDAVVQKTHFDFIVCRYLYRAIPCGLWKYRDRLIVDFDDDLSFYFLNQISPASVWTSRLRLRLAARKARAVSHSVIRKIHAAFFAKKETAMEYHGVFLPNIPYYNESCPDVKFDSSNRRVLFVGQLEYQPNREGLDYFLEQVYRPLSERLPDVEMHIVGLVRNKALRQRWESYQNVTVTGFVDDLRREYEESQVVVVPVRRCGATNIKILEAMSMNRACVATREAYDAFRGQFFDKRDLYVAENAEAFVTSVYTLLTDEAENKRIAHHAQEAMDAYFSFNAFAEIVKKAIG